MNEYYLEINRYFRDAVLQKRQHMYASDNWQLHHDNIHAHYWLLMQTFLVKRNIPVLRQPPYSLDMNTCDFWLLPKLMETMKGHDLIHDRTLCSTFQRLSLPNEVFQQ